MYFAYFGLFFLKKSWFWKVHWIFQYGRNVTTTNPLCIEIDLYKYIVLICVKLVLTVSGGGKQRRIAQAICVSFSTKYKTNNDDFSFQVMSHIWSFLFHKYISIYTLSNVKKLFILLSFLTAKMHRYFPRIIWTFRLYKEKKKKVAFHESSYPSVLQLMNQNWHFSQFYIYC